MGNSISAAVAPVNHVTKKITERGVSPEQGLQFAVSEMKGHRNTMEDKHIHCDAIPVFSNGKIHALEGHSIFGVFDGHGGGFSSNYAAQQFVAVFSRRDALAQYVDLQKTGSRSRADANGVQLLKNALEESFLVLDEQLIPLQKDLNTALSQEGGDARHYPGSKSRSKFPGERSGSTCVVVLVTPTHLICANAGDSRAVLRRRGRVLPLSFDHKPSNLPERARIIGAGGFVRWKRVDGDLAVSRALGDFMYKESKDFPSNRQKVVASPDLIVYPRDKGGDEFIVLACDGVWDVASSEQCTELIQELLEEGENDLGNICEEALDTCLERNSRDNMTLMLVAMPAIKFDKSGSAAFNNAFWGHRANRKNKELSEAVQATIGILP